jgi:hypothetical protein
VVDGKDLSHDDRLTFQHKNITREITEKLLLYLARVGHVLLSTHRMRSKQCFQRFLKAVVY